jgi:group I intron endonuclease
MTGIYAIVCLANRKIYVGQSVDIKRRFHNHKYKLRKGTHTNLSLQRAWKKHGPELFVFTVLEKTSKTTLLKSEDKWISRLNSTNPTIGFNK